ncbi:hypothetical protein R6U77_05160 [Lysinibacillus louembei]|uniref:Uncharacterized protein n=1 Tax=Lysinibacillus louembei TaxID=1470088 RepID=A0ABZ0RXX8_9BACI|nr:hypothetical protein [Lysinibacillus louembei]WPK13077.1 hypothetical protein R6U77_05160 [Lysinibacillus louembei]
MLQYNLGQPTNELSIPNEGEYIASILNIKAGKDRDTVWGTTPSVVVLFELENGQKVMQSMLMYVGKGSLLKKLVELTLDTTEKEVNLHQLVGKSCVVEIQHVHQHEATYANVVDVFPLSEQ